jgi:hypothetical protein
VPRVSDREDHLTQYYGRILAAGSIRLAAIACFAAAALTACGSDERTFTAQEFVDEANAHGTRLTLGEPLPTDEPGTALYGVTIEGPGAEHPGAAPAIPEEGGGGSLRVEETAEAAEAEYARCDQAGLLCYRAANVVLVFEQDVDPESLAALARAIRALEGD